MKTRWCYMIVLLLMWGCQGNAQENKDMPKFAVQKTEQQWRAELTPEEYHILREAGTEPRFSSPILDIKEKGKLVCAACGNVVFLNQYQFESECGWPSFDRAVKGAVVYRTDYKLFYPRTEVLCAKCGSHLGHLFNDGPRKTTGKRYCIDGVALNFIADKSPINNKEK